MYRVWLALAEEANVVLSGYRDAALLRVATDLVRAPAPIAAHREVPHDWFVVERASLVALVEHAARTPGLRCFAWALVWAIEYFLRLDCRIDDLVHCAEQGLAAAESEQDDEGIAAMRLSLSFAYSELDQNNTALAHIRVRSLSSASSG